MPTENSLIMCTSPAGLFLHSQSRAVRIQRSLSNHPRLRAVHMFHLTPRVNKQHVNKQTKMACYHHAFLCQLVGIRRQTMSQFVWERAFLGLVFKDFFIDTFFDHINKHFHIYCSSDKDFIKNNCFYMLEYIHGVRCYNGN